MHFVKTLTLISILWSYFGVEEYKMFVRLLFVTRVIYQKVPKSPTTTKKGKTFGFITLVKYGRKPS